MRSGTLHIRYVKKWHAPSFRHVLTLAGLKGQDHAATFIKEDEET